MFPSWISSPVPNLKCLAQAVQKLWAPNRNPRWRPAAILDFDFLSILIISSPEKQRCRSAHIQRNELRMPSDKWGLLASDGVYFVNKFEKLPELFEKKTLIVFSYQRFANQQRCISTHRRHCRLQRAEVYHSTFTGKNYCYSEVHKWTCEFHVYWSVQT